MNESIVELPKCKCLRCGWEWIPRIQNPTMCPNPDCHSPYWNKPRKNGKSTDQQIGDTNNGKV